MDKAKPKHRGLYNLLKAYLSKPNILFNNKLAITLYPNHDQISLEHIGCINKIKRHENIN